MILPWRLGRHHLGLCRVIRLLEAKSGVDAANPDLYVDHQVILTPDLDGCDAIDLVSSFWKIQGASVSQMDVERREVSSPVICRTFSHLIVHALPTMMSIWRFFDMPWWFSRFHSNRRGDPTMWRDKFGQPAGSAHRIDRFANDWAKCAMPLLEVMARMRQSFEGANCAHTIFIINRSRSSSGDGDSSLCFHNDRTSKDSPEIRVPGINHITSFVCWVRSPTASQLLMDLKRGCNRDRASVSRYGCSD